MLHVDHLSCYRLILVHLAIISSVLTTIQLNRFQYLYRPSLSTLITPIWTASSHTPDARPIYLHLIVTNRHRLQLSGVCGCLTPLKASFHAGFVPRQEMITIQTQPLKCKSQQQEKYGPPREHRILPPSTGLVGSVIFWTRERWMMFFFVLSASLF